MMTIVYGVAGLAACLVAYGLWKLLGTNTEDTGSFFQMMALFGVAGLAAGAYALWKLLRINKEDTGDRTTFVPEPPQVFQASRRRSGSSLQCVLADFVKMKLGVSGKEKHEVIQASLKVATRLRKELQKSVALFKFPKDPEPIGSSSDGTMIQRKGDCDYLLHIEIPSSIVGSTSLVHTGEGYHRVELSSPSQEMKKLTVPVTEEGYVYNSESHCLSPLKVHAFLLGEIDKIVHKLSEIDGIVRVIHASHQAGPALKFRVTYQSSDGTSNTFDMDLVPCFTIDGKHLVGKRHPSQPYYHLQTKETRSDPGTLRWRQSYSSEERDRIEPLDKGDGGWSKKIYRLVKYLRYHQSQFMNKKLSSYIYKTVFLSLLDEHRYPSEWREQKLAARFMDFMQKLEETFRKKELKHYYLLKRDGIDRNLLQADDGLLQTNEFYNFLHRTNMGGEKAWAKIFADLYDY